MSLSTTLTARKLFLLCSQGVKVDMEIKKLTCKSSVTNSFHLGRRHVLSPSGVCICGFFLTQCNLTQWKSVTKAWAWDRGQRKVCLQTISKRMNKMLEVETSNVSRRGHVWHIFPSHSIFMRPNHADSSYFLKKERVQAWSECRGTELFSSMSTWVLWELWVEVKHGCFTINSKFGVWGEELRSFPDLDRKYSGIQGQRDNSETTPESEIGTWRIPNNVCYVLGHTQLCTRITPSGVQGIIWNAIHQS